MNPSKQGRRLVWLASASIIGIFAAIAWWFPLDKPNAALGRLNYPQFLTAIALTLASASAFCIGITCLAKRRRRVFQFTAVWLSTAVALTCAEFVATLLPPLNNPFYQMNEGDTLDDETSGAKLPYVRPPHIHWEGWTKGNIGDWRPDPTDQRRVLFKTDEDGFRNSTKIEKAELVFIGDSFTEAGNVAEEESFVSLTSVQLNRSVRNLGLCGIPPAAELVILERYGLKYNPQVVIWQIYEGNDLSESRRYDIWKKTGFKDVARGTQGTSRWEQWSLSYFLFRKCVVRERDWLGGTFSCDDGSQPLIRFGFLPSKEWIPFKLPQGRDPAYMHPGWEPMRTAFEQGSRRLKKLKIPLIVILIPAKIGVMGRHVVFDEWSVGRVPAELSIPQADSMATRLKILCNRLDVPYVDSTAALDASAAKGELVYFASDTHLAPAGHKVISRLIVKQLGALKKGQ